MGRLTGIPPDGISLPYNIYNSTADVWYLNHTKTIQQLFIQLECTFCTNFIIWTSLSLSAVFVQFRPARCVRDWVDFRPRPAQLDLGTFTVLPHPDLAYGLRTLCTCLFWSGFSVYVCDQTWQHITDYVRHQLQHSLISIHLLFVPVCVRHESSCAIAWFCALVKM